MTMTNSLPDRHVAVLTFPFTSHPGMLLSTVRRLAAATPDTTFSFFSTAKTNQPLFSLPNPENIKPYDVSDGVPDGYVFSGKFHEEINLFLAAAGESFKVAMMAAEAETRKKISCVLSDTFLWFSGDLAEEMGVPWVTFWISGACPLSTHFYTDLIRETVGMDGVAGRENEILRFIPGFPELRLGDLPRELLFGNFESPFSVMLHKMGQALPKADAITYNSFEELEPEINKHLKSKLKNFLSTGPYNLASPQPLPSLDKYDCIPWLDTQKAASVVYIAFGTVAKPAPDEIAALAEALEASTAPFLWSISDNLKEHFPEGFLKRTSEHGKIVPWAPQIQVLAHSSIAVFITHCGWNSMVEAITAGVPLIGRPFFGDQHLDAWMVENVLKIGVKLEGGVFTKSGTMSALELVLSHEKGKKLKEQVGHFKELALEAVGPNGSSSRNFNTLLEIITGQDLKKDHEETT